MEKQLIKRIKLLREWLEVNNQILFGWFYRNGKPSGENADVWKKVNTAHDEARFLLSEVLAAVDAGKPKGFVLSVLLEDEGDYGLVFRVGRVYDTYKKADDMRLAFLQFFSDADTPIQVSIKEIDWPDEDEKGSKSK